MRITFFLIGKTDKEYLKFGTHLYQERISHYIPFQVKVFPDVKRNMKRTEIEYEATKLVKQEGGSVAGAIALVALAIAVPVLLLFRFTTDNHSASTSGTLISSTSNVITIAKTPSLSARMRSLPATPCKTPLLFTSLLSSVLLCFILPYACGGFS